MFDVIDQFLSFGIDSSTDSTPRPTHMTVRTACGLTEPKQVSRYTYY